MLSVVVPAHDEAAVIGDCLAAVARQELGPMAGRVEVIVVANGCSDATAAIAADFAGRVAAAGMRLAVEVVPVAGKAGALNRGDACAAYPARAYLDADTLASPPLLRLVAEALAGSGPAWATGRLAFAPPRTRVTRLFAAAAARMPYFAREGTGSGFYAVNGAGRARWGALPALISDDLFVGGQFGAAERIVVPAAYRWPLPEGFAALVRVRRRQEVGLVQLRRLHPDLMRPEAARPSRGADLARLAVTAPGPALVYAAVTAAAKLGARRGDTRWERAR